MRVSIWQQFSSNHSSHFTVVGIFDTVELAEKAIQELRSTIKAIADWYAEHPEEEEKWSSGFHEITPPEVEMSREYQVVWDPRDGCGLDWIRGGIDLNRAVTGINKVVFVTHPANTWDGAQPFDSLIRRLNGIALVDGAHDEGEYHEFPFGHVRVSYLNCLAPSDEIAQGIADDLRAHVDSYKRAEHALLEQFSSDRNPPWRNPEHDPLMWDVSGAGEVQRDGRKLFFRDWVFERIAWGFPDFYTYLNRRGCTVIDYGLAMNVDVND